jgi:hypothetical protein
MRALSFCPLLMVAIGCVEVAPAPVTPGGSTQVASLERAPRDSQPDVEPDVEPRGDTSAPSGDAGRILVLQTTKLDRYAEVVGVVDVHEAMGTEQAALATLRRKAAAMGADAVIGVEFHHGESEGEPTHLSGMAVRFVSPSTLPRE